MLDTSKHRSNFRLKGNDNAEFYGQRLTTKPLHVTPPHVKVSKGSMKAHYCLFLKTLRQ